jgi:hypothetical protein
MKQFLLVLTLFFLMGAAYAQTSYSEDFESFNVGDYMGVADPDNWSTWSGTVGTTEDVQVTDENASSGSNALKFVSTSTGGGPQDVLLKFNNKFETGTFNYAMNMFVENGKGAYFNFQAEETPGITWALELRFAADGTLDVGGNFSTNYPQGEWFEISLDMNLTAGLWEVFINNDMVGSFANANAVASVDLFPFEPTTGQATYFVDDINWSHAPPMLPGLDAALLSLFNGTMNIAGNEITLTGEVRNLGEDEITSMDIEWSDGTNSSTTSLTGISIPSLESYQFELDDAYTVAEGSGNNLTVTVTSVNGGDDEDLDNNAQSLDITGIVPAPGKRVVAEEATGTWCPWCPRGAVWMDYMADNFGDFFVGIAVHNSDPMENADYDAGITTLPGFTGFPSVAMHRDNIIDPTQMEADFFSRITQNPVAILTNGATYEETTREMEISVTVDFKDAVSGDYRINLVIVEDGVTGTGSAYNQANAYAGGGFGEMGGYEDLPDPVPASQMVYDHVGRELLAGFDGLENSFPASVDAGETHYVFFNYTLPAEYDYDNIHLVALLINPDGTIDNANSTTIDEAIANGLVVSGKEVDASLTSVNIGPNPFQYSTNISLEIEKAAPVSMQVFDASGRIVATRDYGLLQGEYVFPFEASNLENGVYFVQIKVGEKLLREKIILNK